MFKHSGEQDKDYCAIFKRYLCNIEFEISNGFKKLEHTLCFFGTILTLLFIIFIFKVLVF